MIKLINQGGVINQEIGSATNNNKRLIERQGAKDNGRCPTEKHSGAQHTLGTAQVSKARTHKVLTRSTLCHLTAAFRRIRVFHKNIQALLNTATLIKDLKIVHLQQKIRSGY